MYHILHYVLFPILQFSLVLISTQYMCHIEIVQMKSIVSSIVGLFITGFVGPNNGAESSLIGHILQVADLPVHISDRVASLAIVVRVRLFPSFLIRVPVCYIIPESIVAE